MFDAPLEPAPPPIIPVECIACRAGHFMPGRRVVPEETTVSLTYNKASFAAMMATPSDLVDFAVGFSLTEGIIRAPGDIQEIEIVRHPRGIEARCGWRPIGSTPSTAAAVILPARSAAASAAWKA
jgi:formate dehydrogenase assembly factor FdhD